MRQWLVLDRPHPVENSADLWGRCLRLPLHLPRRIEWQKCYMQCLIQTVCYIHLFSDISERNIATSLAGCFSYGNAAGIIFHKVFSAPPVSVTSDTSPITVLGLPINPITETIEHPSETMKMTDEKKEHEAESCLCYFICWRRLVSYLRVRIPIVRRCKTVKWAKYVCNRVYELIIDFWVVYLLIDTIPLFPLTLNSRLMKYSRSNCQPQW